MQDWKLTAIFLFGTGFTGFPLALALLFIFSFITPEVSYFEFLHSNSKAAQYAALFAVMFSLLVGMLLSLNLVVYLNAKYSWYTESAFKSKLGKELRRYVFVPYS